jgi:D-glycero-beta-D-manno-heptose-7-phosphate kinase
MADRLLSTLDAFRACRVGVIGDLMLDRYIFGRAERISQEAPVPVVRVTRRHATPGGAANVLRNIASLGGQAVAFGVVGTDDAGTVLTGALETLGVQTAGVVALPERVTTEKTRVIAEHQQVVRVDQEEDDTIDDATWKRLRDHVAEALKRGKLDALIVEDYAKGLLTPARIAEVASLAQEHGIPAALDPHPANRAPARGLHVLTPNRAEAYAMAGYSEPRGTRPPFESDATLQRVAETLLDAWDSRSLLITLGGDGMALFRPGVPPLHVATHAREVFDVSGAGDTVIATYVLATAAGAAPEEAVELANRAAGIVVGKLGTAPIAADELRAAIAAGDA